MQQIAPGFALTVALVLSTCYATTEYRLSPVVRVACLVLPYMTATALLLTRWQV